jgi:hypothetical protein
MPVWQRHDTHSGAQSRVWPQRPVQLKQLSPVSRNSYRAHLPGNHASENAAGHQGHFTAQARCSKSKIATKRSRLDRSPRRPGHSSKGGQSGGPIHQFKPLESGSLLAVRTRQILASRRKFRLARPQWIERLCQRPWRNLAVIENRIAGRTRENPVRHA